MRITAFIIASILFGTYSASADEWWGFCYGKRGNAWEISAVSPFKGDWWASGAPDAEYAAYLAAHSDGRGMIGEISCPYFSSEEEARDEVEKKNHFLKTTMQGYVRRNEFRPRPRY